MNSCIYEGWVRHRRHAPVENGFHYRLYMMYLDLGELDQVFQGRWLWSTRRANLAWFRRADHLGDPCVNLETAVRDLVADRTDIRPRGPIRLLTHLRYFGHCMNPVSFYYCWDEADRHLETVVAEVHNTPWGEQHCYVLDQRSNEGTDRKLRFRFPKTFHVSPFMGMDQEYDWRFLAPGPHLATHMDSYENGERLLDSTMALRRRPLTGPNLARVLARHPLITAQVVARIYWQAARLWWKKCPFHPHPKHNLEAKVAPQ
ncbi:MAG: DUF1365 domain-containing protein [Phycisphaerae bacterium]|nr:DUF1365 domain-containing protein [Phycisphaerae bacterium]